MRTIYLPRLDNNGNVLRSFACAVLLPDVYVKTKQWPWMMSIHGIGERSEGKEEHLRNLVEGIDFNKDGKIDWAFVIEDSKKAVELYGLVVVVPTYQDFFEPAKINAVYDFVMPEYNLVPKMLLDGFSLGAGAGLKYATSSVTNANRCAYVTPCAPTMNIIDPTVPGKANLPIHFFVNVNDTNAPTNLNVTKTAVNAINATNPQIKAIYTAFNKTGHGGHGESNTIAPPVAPGGQGFTDAAENKYQLYLDILKNGPRQMKGGAVVQPAPAPTPTPIPAPAPTTVTAKVRYELVGSTVKLIGRESTGYKDGLEGRWEFVSGPAGVVVNQVFPIGSSYIDAEAKLPMPGTYVFRFNLRGDPDPKILTIVYGRTVTAFNIDIVTFSDNTTEKATATLLNGKWTIKTSSKTYEL